MTSTDALILGLSADLAPVRRRSVRCEVGALIVLAAGELALILMAGGMRPDMGEVILSPFMAWKIGGLALLAGVSCAVALRSFAPPAASRRELAFAFALAVLVMVAGVVVTNSAESGQLLIERLAPARGLRCAIAIVVLSLPLMSLLAVLMRRAAPVHPKRSALATGLAAATCGALVFTVCCPANDPLYIAVWYAVGIAAVAAAARWLLPRRFRL
ncbi:NrsF family protein [Methylorubrum sp. POS3]|uniref:NrsF family protein n=1 Tax=Methylorubrum sp. POS3 TaxID=2998492 RepID=UPI00372690B2